MSMYLKYSLIALGILIVVSGLFFAKRWYAIKQTNIEAVNICENDELISKLILDNINPFSKFKFLKKRNMDCKILLISNKVDALNLQEESFCSVLDASTNSLSMLIYAYINHVYDRQTASKEMKMMLNLMQPYNYCNEYLNNMVVLIKLKKRYGL